MSKPSIPVRLITFFGLADRAHSLSFNKAITLAFLAQCAFIVAVWAGVVVYSLLYDRAFLAVAANIFPPWHFLAFEALVLMSGFGLKGVALWVDAKLMTGTAELKTAVTVDIPGIIKAIKERRDPKQGIEDTAHAAQVFRD